MTLAVVGLHALLALTTVALVWGRDRSWTRLSLTLGLPVLLGGLVWAWLDPAAIPVAWLTPMREGGTDVTVRVARGEGAGLGLAWVHLWIPWLGPEPRSLATIVRVDAALATTSLTMLAAALWPRVGGVGLVLTAAFASSLPGWTAVLGGGPAPAAWIGIVPALMGLDAAWRGRPLGGVVALLGGAAAATVRVELALLPGLGLGLLALHRAGVGAWMVASWRRRPAPWIAVAVLFVGVAYRTLTPVHLATRELGITTSVLHIVHPMDASVAWGPLILVSMVPVGLALLTIVGALRAPVASAGAGIVLLALFRLYHGSGHGGWLGDVGGAWPAEMMRYLALVGVLIPWVAAVGWERANLQSPRLGRLALVLVLVPAQPGAWPIWFRGQTTPVSWQRYGPLNLDNQVEVRLLEAAARRWPDCGFVAPGEQMGTSPRTWLAWRSGWGVPRGHDARLVLLRDVDGPEAAADQVPGAPACVLLLDGFSCADGSCDAFTSGRAAVLTAPPGTPHAHPAHGWADPRGPRLLLLRGTP